MLAVKQGWFDERPDFKKKEIEIQGDLKPMIVFENEEMIVLNKPAGLDS